MKKLGFLTLLMALLLLGITSTASAAHLRYFEVDFDQLNNSGVDGFAFLTLDRNASTVTVSIEASGLEPNMLHPQHIHGLEDSRKAATCPTPSADQNGDGLVDLAEGLPSYGPVVISLVDFPTADADGNIDYEATLPIDQMDGPLDNREIVLHGMTVNGEYVATLPVACGSIEQVPNMRSYRAELNSLNNSGASADVRMTLAGTSLTVEIRGKNVEAGMVHPQHIHGLADNSMNAVCPDPSADQNGDGLVDLVEGLPSYGPVQLSLEPFPTAPDGSFHYEETFTVDPIKIGPLENRVIVLHGLTVDGEYEATLPIACGQIVDK